MKSERVRTGEKRTILQVEGKPRPGGRFEILAITAGKGNGWIFPAEVLRQSLALWQGVETFVDHSGWLGSRSVRDLAGVCHSPVWDEARQGVRLQLKPLGPSAGLLESLGLELLEGQQEQPRVGFSADIVFQAEGRQATRILRVNSLDLVYNPARGGAFLRGLNAVTTGGETMQEESVKATRLSVNPEGQPGAAKEEEAESQAQLCSYLLETALGAARLPGAASARLRKQFGGRIFSAGELEAAIQEARALVAELTAPALVSGPAAAESKGRLNGMFNTEDQLQAAVDDLLGAPRQVGMEALKVQRLTGIKELYMLLTGDRDLYGGYYASRAALATTADFTGLVKNALNKIVAQQWAELGAAGYDWWRKIVQVEHFDTLNDITGVLVGTVSSLPSVAEGGAYTELVIGDSPESASFTKYGGYIPLTLELIDRDDTRKLRLYPRELAKAGLRNISALVSAVFTANSGVGPTLADGGALFNATAVTTSGGHANLRTAALSASEWETVKAAVYKQPMMVKNASGYYGTGPRMAANPRYLLVPKELELTAGKILYGAYDSGASVIGENLQRQREGDVIVVPEWTDANNWAAATDPRVAPGIVVGERFGLMPEIFIAGDELSPAVFTNDEHRLKVRHFTAILVQDFRALHKSNVA